MNSNMNGNKALENEVEHPDTKCYKCGVNPITGNRYRCFYCKEIDFCEVCELTDDHSNKHAMVKIRRPECDPFKGRLIKINEE